MGIGVVTKVLKRHNVHFAAPEIAAGGMWQGEASFRSLVAGM